MAKFADVFEDVTKDGHKIPKENYLPNGFYPIIDQGQEYIAGYSNDANGLYSHVPAIIFGDHTRVIKYVDMPFFLGADGVKLLRAKNPNANYKYLYYALSNANIPNTGYNRHFKWLKEIDIPIPSESQQANIVKTLDKVSGLITLRKQQLDKLDELVKARFVEMFGDPLESDPTWTVSTFGEQFLISSGGTPATENPSYWEKGTISWIGSNMCQNTVLYKNDGKYITQAGLEHSSAKILKSRTVLVALVGATIGKTALLNFETTTNQNIAAINVRDNFSYTPEYVFGLLQFLYPKFQEIGNGKFKMANLGFIRNLPLKCPPFNLQNEFSDFLWKTEKCRLTVQQGLDKLEMMKKALMQKYFG